MLFSISKIIKETRGDIKELTEAVKALCEILGIIHNIDVKWDKRGE
jgi:hypothetical protein